MKTLFDKFVSAIICTGTLLKAWVLRLVLAPVAFIKRLVTNPGAIKTFFSRSEESAFKSESIDVSLQDSSYVTVFVSVTGTALIVIALLWASNAELDEITRGTGTVIPSSRLQVVENLEGGIIKKIYIKDGDRVRAGQPLLQLDDVHFSAKFRENELEYFSEFAQVVRLEAEVNGEKLTFPDELNGYLEYIRRERDFYESRMKTLDQGLKIAEQEVEKIFQELESVKARYLHLEKSYSLMKKEYDLTRPMAEEGVVSKVQLLRLEQKVSEVESQWADARHSIPKLEAAWNQAQGKWEELGLQFREKAIEELKKAELKLAQLTVKRNSLKDRVARTIVRSPVEGVVKKVHINTVGGVVDPGMELVDIIPVDDSLLVEVKVPAKDIAFMRQDLKAMVRFTAYDFTVYGGLTGVVVHISPDALEDEKGGFYYYLAQVRTEKSYFGSSERQLPIIPGMQAEVDIMTGKKTVLEYLMKPILRARKVALTER